MMFTAYLAKLPNCVNREMIDQAATEFCMQFNTKNNRKKLVKALYSVHRNRQDLLPFSGRFVATLNPCMPDIGKVKPSSDGLNYNSELFEKHI